MPTHSIKLKSQRLPAVHPNNQFGTALVKDKSGPFVLSRIECRKVKTSMDRWS